MCSGLRVILQKRQISIPVLQALSIVQTTVGLNYLNAQARMGGLEFRGQMLRELVVQSSALTGGKHQPLFLRQQPSLAHKSNQQCAQNTKTDQPFSKRFVFRHNIILS